MPATPSDSLLGRAPIQVRAESDAAASSEAAALGGKPAKTPIIAGSVCGGVLVIAWIVGFAIYFRKRQRRKKQKRAAEEGLCEPPPEKINPARSDSERIVIPPDPAILLGYAKAGDIAHPAALSTGSLHEKDKKKNGHGHTRTHSHTKPHKSPPPPGHSRSVSESGLGVGQSKGKHGEDNGEGQRPGHSRSGSAHSSRSVKQLPPVPTSPSNFVPLKRLGSSGHNHLHKKAHSHSHSHSSSSKSRPSSPRKTTDIDDEMTVPLNPHET